MTPNAQYQRGLALNGAGQGAAALELVAGAAGRGHAEAQLQLALWLLTGHNTPARPREGFQLVQGLAINGDPFAQGFCASLVAGGTGTGQSWPKAISWLLLAAQGGLARAITQLALLLLDRGPEHSKAAQRWLALAAAAGDAAAQHIFGAPDGSAHAWPAPEEWASLEAALAPGPQLAVAENAELLEPSIELCRYPRLVAPDLCAYLCAAAEPFLSPAHVNDAAAGERVDHSRTNEAMGFYPLEADVISYLVRWRLAVAARRDPQCAEVLSVLRYQPGQRYLPHFDFFDPEFPAHKSHLGARGQRVSTALLYLNDNYHEGQTHFVSLERRVRGGRGDVLTFTNVGHDGTVNRETLHEGLAPAQGQKWLASLWIRDRAEPDDDRHMQSLAD